MNDKNFEEIIKKAKDMQNENPEEFAEKIEEMKKQVINNKTLMNKFNKLDDDKKQEMMDLLEQAKNIRDNKSKEEQMELIQEMKSKLSPEDQAKIEKAAKVLKEMFRRK